MQGHVIDAVATASMREGIQILKLFKVLVLGSIFAAGLAAGQETEIIYLSGRGKDDGVE